MNSLKSRGIFLISLAFRFHFTVKFNDPLDWSAYLLLVLHFYAARSRSWLLDCRSLWSSMIRASNSWYFNWLTHVTVTWVQWRSIWLISNKNFLFLWALKIQINSVNNRQVAVIEKLELFWKKIDSRPPTVQRTYQTPIVVQLDS